ncbi:TSUP family transporter [Nocardioides sp. B-3]|uniref:TSUP family transporter n=1 Tax=Nocardioides sp. B-3 TaxID=2895565 RepID=UPI0021535DBC|nr:TSUP family transporter [Nocardioides sp. B-3]UUZ59389.1 TSUP family transporter [Nocardioides sp. B-3]
MPVGVVALMSFDEHSLTALVALALLLAVLMLWRDLALPAGRPSVWAAGVTSGVLLTSTGMNGPPLVLSLHGARLPAQRFRATLQAVFCSRDAVAVAAFAVLGQLHAVIWAAAIGGVVGLPLGWAIGDRIFERLSPERFRSIVLGGLLLTALVALGNVAISG